MSINTLIDFKENLITFIDELIEQFPQEADLIICRIFLNNKVPIEKIMNYFLRQILPLKEFVQKRNDNFFMKHNILFGKLNKDKVNHFKTLWSSTQLDEGDRKIIWQWFDLFIHLSEKYQKCKLKEDN